MDGRDHTGSLRFVNTLFFLVILFIGVYFGKERSVMYDGSYSIFVVAEQLRLPISDYRITASFHSLLPLLVSWLGGSMQLILYSYVVNYLALPVIVFWLMAYRSAHLKYQTAFLIALSLFNASAFFIAVHDYWAGFFLIFLLYRLLDDESLLCKKSVRYLVAVLLIILMMFSHINVIYSLVFLLCYLYLKDSISFRMLGVLNLLVLVFIVTKFFWFTSNYEQGIIGSGEAFSNKMQTFFLSNTFEGLLQSFTYHNINFLILFVLLTAYTWYKKLWVVFGTMLIGVICPVFILSFVFPGYGYHGYIEGYLKMMMVLPAIIAADKMYHLIVRYRAAIVLVFINFLFSLSLLFYHGITVKERYRFISTLSAGFETPVLLKTDEDMSPYPFMFFPLETSIINMVENGSPQYLNLQIRGDSLNIIMNDKFSSTQKGRYFKLDTPAITVNADDEKLPVSRLMNDRQFTFHYFDMLQSN